jgi:hypothetical protein
MGQKNMEKSTGHVTVYLRRSSNNRRRRTTRI